MTSYINSRRRGTLSKKRRFTKKTAFYNKTKENITQLRNERGYNN